MPFAEHDNMVKTIPSDRTDEPLRISVLPWRPWRDRPIPYAHCSKPLDDDIAIDAIPIANDTSWRLLPAVGFGQLTGNPMGARARGHTQPQKLSALPPIATALVHRNELTRCTIKSDITRCRKKARLFDHFVGAGEQGRLAARGEMDRGPPLRAPSATGRRNALCLLRPMGYEVKVPDDVSCARRR
jgi:hypothetical protein